jgi:hypothetical protein
MRPLQVRRLSGGGLTNHTSMASLYLYCGFLGGEMVFHVPVTKGRPADLRISAAEGLGAVLGGRACDIALWPGSTQARDLTRRGKGGFAPLPSPSSQ